MKRILGLLLVPLLLVGCASQPEQKVTINPVYQHSTYKGTLPCADCAGIQNTLVLYRDQFGTPTRYKLTEKYIGGSENLTVINHGDWKIKQVKGQDEIFVLSAKDPQSRKQFAHTAVNAIELRGDNGQPAQSNLNYTLLLVK